MKIKHFYSHLVEVNEITLELGNLEVTREERLELISLVEANIHSTVINTVLSNLSEKQKQVFLANLVESDHEKIWAHLKENAHSLEEKIQKNVKILIKDLRKDIKNLKSIT